MEKGVSFYSRKTQGQHTRPKDTYTDVEEKQKEKI